MYVCVRVDACWPPHLLGAASPARPSLQSPPPLSMHTTASPADMSHTTGDDAIYRLSEPGDDAFHSGDSLGGGGRASMIGNQRVSASMAGQHRGSLSMEGNQRGSVSSKGSCRLKWQQQIVEAAGPELLLLCVLRKGRAMIHAV